MSAPDRQPPTLSRRKTVLFSAILAAALWGVLELTAVAYLRYSRGYDGEHLYEFDYDPYKNILPARGFVDRRGVRHNSQGFRRSTEVARAKPAGTYRIFLMGGSAAYGTGGLWPHLQREYAVLDNAETIDAYLERMLADSLPGVRVEVINAAITSTWTHHHLIYLNQTLLGYEPDMVLFMDGYNDYFHTAPTHDQFGDYLYKTEASRILGEPTLGALVAANGWWLYRRDPLAHVTIRALRNLKLLVTAERDAEREPIDVAGAMSRLRQVFPRSALRMHRRSGLILRDEGVIPVFMLQPMLIAERDNKPMEEMERRLFDFNVTSHLPRYEQFAREAIAYFREQEETMAREIGAEYIDLTGIYAGVPEQTYTDYVHLTPRGNELLALHVAGRLLPVIRADLTGPLAGVDADGRETRDDAGPPTHASR